MLVSIIEPGTRVSRAGWKVVENIYTTTIPIKLLVRVREIITITFLRESLDY